MSAKNFAFEIEYYGEKYNVFPAFGHFRTDDTLSVDLHDAETYELFVHLTMCLPPLGKHLRDGEVYVRNYGEAETIVDQLVEKGFLEDTGTKITTGYVMVPKMRLAGLLAEALKDTTEFVNNFKKGPSKAVAKDTAEFMKKFNGGIKMGW